jgi:hypothetical protein
MNHHTTADFWACYNALPEAVRKIADDNYNLLRADPRHPSLHLKRVGRPWLVRVGSGYRALAPDGDDGLIWFWIGSHAQYDRILREMH